MQYVGRSSVTTDLQSDVLLPCNFKATLLRSNKTADIAAVWSHRTIPADNLVEISLQGEEMFWNNSDKRIKTFTKLSESGNFSILLRNVQQSDLGLYRCELHEGINCSIAYQEVQLGVSEYQKTIIAGTSGAVVLLLLPVCICCTGIKGRFCMRQEGVQASGKRDTKEETIYENDMELRSMKSACRGCCQNTTQENPIYVNCERNKTWL
ncbi:uncharacterized protein LOC108437636 [Pygocentrus nattereri]|uniref:uncharacterized protein LOC108437636 n=1 Tax=Pygocentrus nattereri TaxID=42514 RepID=UPI0018914D62|nr:uncharacterized protein LOC108437636 [Pygocentrus nattereri]